MPVIRLRQHRLVLLVSQLCGGLLLAYASASVSEENTLPDHSPNIAAETVDVSHDYVAEEFVNFVTNIDHFFGGERDFQENNQSVLQFDMSELMQQGGARQGQFNGRTKISLPSTEKRLHLLVEADPEKGASSTDALNKPKTVDQVNAPQNVGVAARYEKAEESAWHYSTDIGIRTPLPLQPFARARVSYSIPIATSRIKLTQSAYVFSIAGAGESTQLDIENQFNPDALFRATSTATWGDIAQNFDLSQSFSVYHTIDSKHATLYQASVIGSSNPKQISDYVFSAAYRQQLNRRWLYFEINPQLHFPKSSGYNFTPLLFLRLEVLFDSVKEPSHEAATTSQ